MELWLWAIYILIVLYAIAPLNSLIHEFGHAIPSLIFGTSGATIILGNGDSPLTFRLGKLNFSLSHKNSWIGLYRYDKMPTLRWKRVLIRVLGPIFSLLTAASWWWLSMQNWAEVLSLEFLFRGASFTALFQFVMTIIPMHYGKWNPGYEGYSSDGMNILREFRPAPPVTAEQE